MRDFKTIAIKAITYSAAVLALSSPLALNVYAADEVATTSEQTVTATTKTIASGKFSGRSKHVTTGSVEIIKTATGYQLVLGSDFSLDNAPDPVVALGNNDKFLVANKISGLKNKKGEQVYNLPASFTPAQFSQAYIWCEKFDLPLGIADLTKT